MKYIVLFLIIFVTSLIYDTVSFAKPAPRLDPVYPAVIYIHRCGRLVQMLYTTSRGGLEETNESDGKETSEALKITYVKALQGGFLINVNMDCI